MKKLILTLAMVATLASAAHAQILENVGTIPYDQTPGGGNLYTSSKFGVTDIGWLITSPDTFTVSQIGTEFGQSTSGNFPGNPSRSITAEIFSGVPAQGGTLLGTATINPVADQMSFGSISSPITLDAGQTYFIGFENVGQFAPNETADPSANYLNALYVDYSNENTFYTTISASVAPIFEIDGTAVPEPGSWTLGLCALAVLGALRFARQARI